MKMKRKADKKKVRHSLLYTYDPGHWQKALYYHYAPLSSFSGLTFSILSLRKHQERLGEVISPIHHQNSV